MIPSNLTEGFMDNVKWALQIGLKNPKVQYLTKMKKFLATCVKIINAANSLKRVVTLGLLLK